MVAFTNELEAPRPEPQPFVKQGGVAPAQAKPINPAPQPPSLIGSIWRFLTHLFR